MTPPIRTPKAKMGGLHYFGRMLDKLRCEAEGTLPEDYRTNLGMSVGLDGFLCGFLGVNFGDVRQKIAEGMSDEEVVEWCFTTGLRPNPIQRRIWNGFSEKFGWRDLATSAIDDYKKTDGLENREDIQTAFELLDEQEGRGSQGRGKKEEG